MLWMWLLLRAIHMQGDGAMRHLPQLQAQTKTPKKMNKVMNEKRAMDSTRGGHGQWYIAHTHILLRSLATHQVAHQVGTQHTHTRGRRLAELTLSDPNSLINPEQPHHLHYDAGFDLGVKHGIIY